jgi:hypothetical protein
MRALEERLRALNRVCLYDIGVIPAAAAAT